MEKLTLLQTGVYSDEVYKEQSRVIENKIANVEVVLSETLFDKYSIDDVSKFMKDKFSDLVKTYNKSNPGERRVLLGSIAPSGLH